MLQGVKIGKNQRKWYLSFWQRAGGNLLNRPGRFFSDLLKRLSFFRLRSFRVRNRQEFTL